MSFRLPPATHIGAVHLKIAEPGRMLAFYSELLGLKEIARDEETIHLSASGAPPAIVKLTTLRTAKPRAPRSTGLFHMAIRVPGRADLANVLRQLIVERWPLEGASDHGVSEALYLSDPEDNGIEIYVDRPRDLWPVEKGKLAMTTAALDVEELLKLAADKGGGLPPGTVMGHVHLRVSDLKNAREFYHDFLGFDISQDSYAGALFFSAGGYHHHVAANVWGSRGAPNPPPDTVGLRGFQVIVPDADALSALWNRLQDTGVYVSSVQSEGMAGISAPDRDNNLVEILAPSL